MGLLTGSGSAAFKSVDRTNFYATAGQTTFTVTQGYSVGDIDVYLNGIRIVDADDYFATNGSTIVLSSAAALNDHLLVVSYNQFSAANTYAKSESDSRYMVATGQTPMTSYLRTPNYGVSSYSDSASASLEASAGAGTSGVGVKAWGRSVATFGGDIHYITDTRGASGAHRFYSWNGTTWIQTMGVDASGRVTKPYQPCIMGQGNNATNVSYGANGRITHWDTSTNGAFIQNMTFNNGVVTVPVAGKYHWCATVYDNDGGTAGARFNILHNGTQRALAHGEMLNGQIHLSIVLNMAANDYIEFSCVYNTAYYMGPSHFYMSGHLIG